ncbi:hypothetical protein [Mesorhizobium sp. B263B2A]|uniref:hypothetical protein n=1 Tax=Mesorhizobium sp. B263B2A TaxID=2876669 RepID=UPI001CD13914|nr:hypothetical protein [Mesorhizobium sp. B263B2A]MCA0032785.1 hypothetical protein [Mesorhizobium sp. B263B2A]
MSDRVDFNDDGTLDEVVSTKGAHLEHLGGNRWFLIFYHEDGTDTAIWFSSRDLKRPFGEKRRPRARTERSET